MGRVSLSGDTLLHASGLRKHYGAVVALENASLGVERGEIHALLGANGTGKSTVVKVLTGVIRADRGRKHRARVGMVLGPLDDGRGAHAAGAPARAASTAARTSA